MIITEKLIKLIVKTDNKENIADIPFGFNLCMEELEMDIKLFEDDWSRNPQTAFELFKSKYIK